MWKGKKFSDLNAEELQEAMAFYQSVYNEIHNSAPTPVWGYFSDRLTDLTIIACSRMARV